MKVLKPILVATLCLLVLPAMAEENEQEKKKDNKKEIRKEKRRFTKEVRAMKAAKNYKPSSKEIAFQSVAKGKF